MTETDPELVIRPATVHDFPGLLDLNRQLIENDVLSDEGRQLQTFKQMLAHPGLTILIAFKAQKPVATCLLVIVPNLTRGCASFAIIENVVTHSDWRGKGIGRVLMENAIERAFSHGCFKVMLQSGAANEKAHRFYERLGFSNTKVGYELRAPGYPARKLSR